MAGNSRISLLATLQSMKDYVDDRTVLFESYVQSYADIESRNDIPRARIALYEISENVTDRVDQRWANFSQVTYGLDISVLRSYYRDDSSRGELPLLDLKDAIITWASTFDASTATTQRIYTFAYVGSNTIIRNDRYVTMTITFLALKDLSTNQI